MRKLNKHWEGRRRTWNIRKTALVSAAEISALLRFEIERMKGATKTHSGITITHTPRNPRHDGIRKSIRCHILSPWWRSATYWTRQTPISPTEYAKKLAESKAFALAEHRAKDSDGKSDNSNKEIDSGHETTFILGSDTIVDKDGMILEKPKSEQQAVDILTRL